ncbi:MAG: VWA domain-containing protein [Planctomycetes bacterium]|nr:VWA domain-containing protein [Planctomycetota bacterium]
MDAARVALEEITGEKLGLDPGAWEKWLADRKAGAPPPEADPASSVATYYGMRVFSDRVLFVVDVSGSMKAGEPERIATAREELKKVLAQLNPKTLMNIVAFSGTPRWWRDGEVEASPANLAAAKDFADKLEAGGGTNVYDTLEQAFTQNREIDTIYFLGDGSPSLGTYTEQEEILARVRSLNRMRKIRIHCIALLRGEVGRFGGRMGPGLGRGRSISDERAYDEEEAARFLARLATEHGGSFLRVE